MVWHYFYFEFHLFQVFTVLKYSYGTTLEIFKNLLIKLLILLIKNFVVPKNIVKNPCLPYIFQKDGLGGKLRNEQWWHLLQVPTFVEVIGLLHSKKTNNLLHFKINLYIYH